MQSAAEHDVDQLSAPANAEQGPVAFRTLLDVTDQGVALSELTLSIGETALSLTQGMTGEEEEGASPGELTLTTLHLDGFLPASEDDISAIVESLTDRQANLLAQESKKQGGVFAWLAAQPLDLKLKADALSFQNYLLNQEQVR